MHRRSIRTVPSLKELQDAYPRDWAAVQLKLSVILPRGDREELLRYVASQRGIRHQLAVAAIKQLSVAAITGVDDGRVRFNLLNGKVAQKLLFDGGGFVRKPVSSFWFRLVWPLVWQKRFLMPLVASKGIYCFYSKPLIKALATLIGDRQCVEIAAGDGTLSRFLTDAGVCVTATDDHSWSDVQFPDSVIREDAAVSLRTRGGQVVLCSWPPANNRFERAVFKPGSAETYIVIGSRHQFASGNWTSYREQTTFSYREAPELSKLVLPPELEAAVYVFTRV
jgi:hypothetical protein